MCPFAREPASHHSGISPAHTPPCCFFPAATADGIVHCMDPLSFEQLAVPADLFGDAAAYLKEGLEVVLSLHEGEAVAGQLPQAVTLRVAQAAPSIKGETAAPSYKPAVLENGVQVQVPSFVTVGDSVVVDTATGEFLKRG